MSNATSEEKSQPAYRRPLSAGGDAVPREAEEARGLPGGSPRTAACDRASAGACGPDARPGHHLQGAIDRGLVLDRATVAPRLGLLRARVTQLLDLLLLAPDLQAQLLELEAIDGAEPMSERALRPVAHVGNWAELREAWAAGGRRG